MMLLCVPLQLISPINGQPWTFDTLGSDSVEITYFIFGYLNCRELMVHCCSALPLYLALEPCPFCATRSYADDWCGGASAGRTLSAS